jgi:putative membrane protein
MMWNYGFGWGFPFFPFVWILFWLLIVFLFWGRWHRWDKHSHWQKEKSAEEILGERFAKGEIDEEEYSKRLTVLRKHAK